MDLDSFSIAERGPIKISALAQHFRDVLTQTYWSFNFADETVGIAGLGRNLVDARDKNYRQLGMKLFYLSRKFCPGHSGHEQVREHKVNRLGLQKVQCFSTEF